MKPLSRCTLGLTLGALLLTTAHAEVQVAGSLVVDIDATQLPAGPTLWVTNSGAAGGVFEATGLPVGEQPLVTPMAGGAKGLQFDGRSFMQHMTAPGGTKLNLPAAIAGSNAPCSVEVWVLNPNTWDGDGETMVYWGLRGSGGSHMVFTYSANGDHGATDHWGGNMPWTTLPKVGEWHHLVYTYDGNTQKIYADGKLDRTGTASYNPTAAQPVLLAAQREPNGNLIGWGWVRGSLTLAKVRIHSAPLTEAQVVQNYDLEKAAFVPAPTPLASKPLHRYSFSLPATNDAVYLEVPDTGTAAGAPGLVQGFYGSASVAATGTKISLPGGDPATSAYIDLPNGLISNRSSANGGSGKLSLEGWARVTATRVWPRLFDFGSTDVGEITAPGGAGQGRNYFMFAQINNYRDWHRVEVNNHGYNGGPNAGVGVEFGNFNNDGGGFGMRHYAVTWDEASGEIVVYINGVAATRMTTAAKFNHVEDLNCWLGRSNWLADQNCAVEYDEFRVYGHVLSGAEVYNNFLAGPDAVAVAPGALLAVRLSLQRATMMVGTYQQATLYGDYENVADLNVTGNPGVVFTSSDTNVFTVNASGRITAVGQGNANLTASYNGKQDVEPIQVTPITATLAHRYSFSEAAGTPTAADSVGGAAWDAMVIGSPLFQNNQFQFDGGTYLQLPANILSGMDAVTVEAWGTFGTMSDWVRLWDFGDQTPEGNARTTFFFAPHGGGGIMRLNFQDTTRAVAADVPGALDNRTNVHIAAVVHPQGELLALYINGARVAANTTLNVALSSVNSSLNYIGKSLYNVDPLLGNTLISEFRIYNGVLTREKLAINAAAGPDAIINDPGTLNSINLIVTNPIPVGLVQQSVLLGSFANIANVNLLDYGQPVFSSDNTNIVTVSSTGLMRAISPGTTTVRASFGGKTDAESVTVSILPPQLTHRYSFNDAAGSPTATDSVGGAAWNGTLNGPAVLDGSKLVLDGSQAAFVQLPAGIVSGYNALTFDIWVTFGPLQGWGRLYDFGDQTGNNGRTSIFFSPRTGGGTIEQTIFRAGANDHIAITPALDNRTVHITAVYNPYSGQQRLYYNGALVGQNNNAVVLISEINDALNYIGKSLFNADPGINAQIDEFRIYHGALSQQQAAINDAAGPNSIVTDPGALQSISLVVNTNLIVDQTVQAQLQATFANVSGVNLFNYANPTLTSSDPSVVTVTPSGLVKAVGPGQAVLTAGYQGSTYTRTVYVSATTLMLKHRYAFSDLAGAALAEDLVGDADVTLYPGANLDGSGLLILDGQTGFGSLPAGVISGLSNLTFELWVTATGTGGNWQRVLDFGIDDGLGAGSNYVFITGRVGTGTATRFAVKAGPAESPIIEYNEPLFGGEKTYLALVYNVSANTASFYRNGVLMGTGTGLPLLSSIMDTNNYLGRSQFSGDALFSGSYDEFRIWEGALTAQQVAGNYVAGPNAIAGPKVQIKLEGNNLVISWASWATGMKLYSSTSLAAGAGWTQVNVTPVSGPNGLTVTIPKPGLTTFYKLSN